MKDIAEFTELLLNEIRIEFSIKPVKFEKSDKIYVSTVLFTRMDKHSKWFGFIQDTPDDIFFHEFNNKNLDFTSLKGRKIEFKINDEKRGNIYAYDSRLIEWSRVIHIRTQFILKGN